MPQGRSQAESRPRAQLLSTSFTLAAFRAPLPSPYPPTPNFKTYMDNQTNTDVTSWVAHGSRKGMCWWKSGNARGRDTFQTSRCASPHSTDQPARWDFQTHRHTHTHIYIHTGVRVNAQVLTYTLTCYNNMRVLPYCPRPHHVLETPGETERQARRKTHSL